MSTPAQLNDYLGANKAYRMFIIVVFAWEAYEKGADVHLQADPTKLELLKREYSQRKGTHEDSKKNAILDKYGGVEHLQAPPTELFLAQTVSRSCLCLSLPVAFAKIATTISRPAMSVLTNRRAVYGKYFRVKLY